MATFIFLIIGLLLLTPLRGGLLVVMPIIPLLLYGIQKYSVDIKRFRWLVILFLVSTGIGLYRNTTDIENVLLSAWLLLPILLLFYATPKVSNIKFNFEKYYNVTLFILIIVDLIGFYVWYWLGHGGDEMGTAYGRHYEYVHGLAMVNAMYIFYYIAKIRKGKFKKKEIVPLVILSFSFVFCDFGLGELVVFGTIVVLLIMERKFKYLLLLGILSIVASFVYYSDAFSYNRQNIEEAQNDDDNARKVIMFYSSAKVLTQDPVLNVSGTGPGGYNSRVSSLLSGNNENIFTILLGEHQPKYYWRYIYPLWNSRFVSQDDFTDGTRNKPYSSFVALIVEYGWIFALIIILTFIKRIKDNDSINSDSVLNYYILILDIFMFIACISHEWMVTTEFLVYILLRFYATKQIKVNEKK